MSNDRKKNRPRYEDYGVSRAQIEKDWDQLVSWGFIGSKEADAELIRAACQQMCFTQIPKDDWAYIARELRIISFQLPQAKKQDSLSRSQMAKKCIAISEQLSNISEEMGDFADGEDFTMAAKILMISMQSLRIDSNSN